MTEFRVEAVRIGPIEKHPNADTLSITQVLGGYPCIIKTGDFAEGEIAAYVPVDALVPVSRPEFQFLAGDANADGFARIKARRLRQIFSMGLLVKAPAGVNEGDDCQALLGVDKWLPPAEREHEPNQPRAKKQPSVFVRVWTWFLRAIGMAPPEPPKVPIYDIEGWRKYKGLFECCEEVSITEKIHGANCRYTHDGKRLWIGSRTTWKKAPPSIWHTVAEMYKLDAILQQYPGAVLFGEVYGNVQDLKYGKGNGVDFAAFDLMWIDNRTGERRYQNTDDFRRFCMSHMIPMVPELYRGPWRPELVSLAEGKTTIPGANHVREGIVIKPTRERIDPHFGRVILKLAGEGYLTRKEPAQAAAE